MRNLNISRTNVIFAALCIVVGFFSLNNFSQRSDILFYSQAVHSSRSNGPSRGEIEGESYISQAANLVRSTLNGNAEPVSEECNSFLNKIRSNGYYYSTCKGYLGSMAGVMGLGLPMYLQFGVYTVLDARQGEELANAFEVYGTCSSDLSNFCVVAPPGCEIEPRRKFDIIAKTSAVYKEGLRAFADVPSETTAKKIGTKSCPTFLPLTHAIYYAEFVKQMKLRDDVAAEANQVLKKTKERSSCVAIKESKRKKEKTAEAGTKSGGCRLAVFHVRGAEYINKLKDKRRPHVVKDTDYIHNTLLYLKQHYSHFRCAVIGDHSQEQQDVEDILKQNGCGDFRDPVLEGGHEGVDFVTIMKSDIVVITHGSFGIYASYLGNHRGDILFPARHPDMKRFGLDSYFLPRFKPINWTLSGTASE